MKKLIFLCVLIFAGAAKAQTPAEQSKRSFQDSDGKIFWQVDLPVYLNISSKPDGSEGFRMKTVKSESMNEFSNPFYFDGPGIHYIRHIDYEHNIPEKEVAFAVHVDGAAPSVKLEFSERPAFKKGNIDIFGAQKLQIRLFGEDEMSGLEAVYYSLDGEPYQKYENEITVEEDRAFIIQYYAADRVGNISEPQKTEFALDRNAPETLLEVMGRRHEDVISGNTIIKLSPSDLYSGIRAVRYSLGDVMDKVYSREFNMRNYKEGPYSLTYYAEDNLNNRESLRKFDFFLDKSPPNVEVGIEGDQHQSRGRIFISDRSRVKIEADDNKAGVNSLVYQIDNEEEEEYDRPFALPRKQGAHVIRYKAEDRVGNQTGTRTDDRFGSVYMDLSAPEVSHSFTGPQFLTRDTLFIKNATKIVLHANDPESGISRLAYSVNGNSESVYESPFSLEESGIKQISYNASDNVGNKVEQSFFVVTDNEGPKITMQWSMNAIGQHTENGLTMPVYSKHAILYLAATDELIGAQNIYYSLDKSREVIHKGPLSSFPAGNRRVDVRATDQLGNETVQATFYFRIE